MNWPSNTTPIICGNEDEDNDNCDHAGDVDEEERGNGAA